MQAIVAFARRTRRAIRLYGPIGALRRAASALRRRPAGATAVDAFDERFGVETSGVVRLEGLTVHGERDLAVRYQPSEPEAVRHLLTELPIDARDFVFVDLGSGKGLAVLVASQMPWRKVVGVEFCEELHDAAVRNVASFPPTERACGEVELLCLDAARFEFPPQPLVLYLYNPFLPAVMRAVLANLLASLRDLPRPVYIVMTGDQSLAGLVRDADFKPVAGGVFARMT